LPLPCGTRAPIGLARARRPRRADSPRTILALSWQHHTRIDEEPAGILTEHALRAVDLHANEIRSGDDARESEFDRISIRDAKSEPVVCRRVDRVRMSPRTGRNVDLVEEERDSLISADARIEREPK